MLHVVTDVAEASMPLKVLQLFALWLLQQA
jgi:hypothetical protein